MTEKEKKENPFKRHDQDTWSSETQIRLLSQEIKMLQWHIATHPKDFDSKRSLLKKVARRRKFMKFIKQKDLKSYNAVSKKLSIKV
jgi:small subunit ribosomal protein S15